MAIREYIGARYVPRVSKNGLLHNPIFSYEALDLVQNAEGTTYLSIRPVPTGIELSNTDYWILTAMTNAQLAQLLTEVNSLNTRMDAVEEVTIKPETIVFIGDSFGHGRTSVGEYTPWPEITANLLNVPSARYYSLCVDGAGFVAGSGANKSFIHLINQALTEITFTANDVTKVIIGGGQNDFAYHNILMTNPTYNIPATIALAKSSFPKAKIYVGMLAHDFLPATANANNSFSNQIDTLKKYRNSAAHGAIYLTGVENALHRKDMLAPDGIHPIGEGQYELAQAISMSINCSTYEPADVVHTVEITSPPTGISFDKSEVREVLTPNGVLVGMGDTIVKTTGSAYDSFLIGYIEPNYFSVDQLNLGFRQTVQVQIVKDNVNSATECKIGLALTDNKIGVYIDFNSNVGAITQINIKSQNLFLLPLMNS